MISATRLSAQDVFTKYDTDKSGTISFTEFQRMLPDLGIGLSVPTQIEYFRLCDKDCSGQIDFEEFKVALYACDTEEVNPAGFNPGAILRPKDAFEMFDKDGSGRIDEEEFHFLLKYLNIDIDEHTHEKFFRKYDSDKSGYIEYPEFKKAWLRLGNTRKELETREIQIPTLATRAQMIGMLDKILEEEESQEQLAIEEAKKYRLMQERLKYMKEYIGKAKHQSNVELSAALDAGGSVYVFGSGTLNQFSKPPRSNNVNQPFHLKGYDRLLSLWQSRVGGSCGGSRERGMHHMKPISLEEELKLGFNNIDNATGLNGLVHLDQEFNLQTNTVWLWGRQCKGVVVSNNVILAHSKNGALYSWGGNEQWWHQLENDSCWQTKTRGLLTARSRGLLGFPSDQDANSFSQKSGNTISSKSEKSEELLVVIRTVLQYYNAWSTPDGQTNSLDHAKKSLKDNIDRQRVSWSLKLRDKPTDNLTKLEMVKILHRDILLEYKLLGEPEHLELRELEMEMIEMRQQQKLKLAKRRRLRFIEKWRPLREAQKLDAHSILIEKNKGIGELSTSSSDQEHNLRVKKLSEKDDDRFESKADGFVVKGITPRGPQPSSVVSSSSEEWEMIDAGANHAGMVDNKGRLFTWGSNTTGQLGILEEATNSNNCRQQEGLEKFQPKKVNILNVSKFSCGHSHTAAVDKSGKLYVWGSASCGKLGLGSSVSNTECYASIPVILKSLSTKRIIVVSCGSGHTACVEGDNGGFYVWGDGGGGRLGLGHKRDVFAPTLVKSLSGERIVDVSCGNCQTLAITAIDESVAFCNQSKVKNISGGKLLVAGPKEVVGYDFSSFGEYSFFTNDDNEIGPEPVRNISAGFTHQSIITSNGELFIWGDNYNGCCGKDYAKFHFLSTPTKVKLYENPIDLAEGKKTHQSIPYGTQPFFEVDLGQVALIREIKLWNNLEVPNNPAVRKNKFTGRLFPCWIMIAPEPFPDNIGEGQLQAALDYCSCKKRFDENQQKSCWKPPRGTRGRIIRLQLENMNLMEFDKLQVFGSSGADTLDRVISSTCGKRVTAAIISPTDNVDDITMCYRRAVAADPNNVKILQQFDLYRDIKDSLPTLESIVPYNFSTGCILCNGRMLCPLCRMKNDLKDELFLKATQTNEKRVYSLDDIVTMLLSDD